MQLSVNNWCLLICNLQRCSRYYLMLRGNDTYFPFSYLELSSFHLSFHLPILYSLRWDPCVDLDWLFWRSIPFLVRSWPCQNSDSSISKIQQNTSHCWDRQEMLAILKKRESIGIYLLVGSFLFSFPWAVDVHADDLYRNGSYCSGWSADCKLQITSFSVNIINILYLEGQREYVIWRMASDSRSSSPSFGPASSQINWFSSLLTL